MKWAESNKLIGVTAALFHTFYILSVQFFVVKSHANTPQYCFGLEFDRLGELYYRNTHFVHVQTNGRFWVEFYIWCQKVYPLSHLRIFRSSKSNFPNFREHFSSPFRTALRMVETLNEVRSLTWFISKYRLDILPSIFFSMRSSRSMIEIVFIITFLFWLKFWICFDYLGLKVFIPNSGEQKWARNILKNM